MTIMHAMALGLVVAFWTCMDPVIATAMGFRYFKYYFPFLLSAILAMILIALLLLFTRIHSLWNERDRWAIIFTLVMAQFSGIELGPIHSLDVVSLVLLLSWLLQSFAEGDRKIQISPLFMFILGLVLLSMVPLAFRAPFKGIIAMGEKFILFLLIVDLMRRKELVQMSARFVIWMGIFSSVVSLVQFVIFKIWGFLFTIGAPTENPNSFLKPTPFGMMPRATAFFPNPAGLNDYLLFSLSVCLFALFYCKTKKLKLLYSIGSLLMISAIVLTWSFTALVGLGLIGILFLYIYRPSYSIQYSCALGFVVIVCYEVGLLEKAFQFVKNFSSTAGGIRIRLLELGVESLARNPFIGVGAQNFKSYTGNFFTEGPYIFKYPVHNAFVQMATELGIFGGLLFLGMVIFLVMRLIMVLRSGLEEGEKWIFKGFLLGLLAIIIHMLTEPMAYEATLWMIFGLMEGAAMTVLRENKVRREAASLYDGPEMGG
jgi:O-antigen ligase